jgi:hypothetical protein
MWLLMLLSFYSGVFCFTLAAPFLMMLSFYLGVLCFTFCNSYV